MELFDVLQKRHSYRKNFLNKEIPDEDLKKIVSAGIMAPSGCNAQTTDFVIINDKMMIKKIALLLQKDFLSTAQAVIVCLHGDVEAMPGVSFVVEDCAAAVQNMLLAITALGYATVWMDGVLRREGRAEQIAKMIHAPQDKKVRVILPVGVPEETLLPNEKKSFDQRACFNSYSQ